MGCGEARHHPTVVSRPRPRRSPRDGSLLSKAANAALQAVRELAQHRDLTQFGHLRDSDTRVVNDRLTDAPHGSSTSMLASLVLAASVTDRSRTGPMAGDGKANGRAVALLATGDVDDSRVTTGWKDRVGVIGRVAA